jgi:CTP-dependent riboflavin kinase
MSAAQKIQGLIFSDLGQASRFMALDWVQRALVGCLGFAPFPATLNVRPAHHEDAVIWRSIRDDTRFFSHMPGHEGSCVARIYRIEIQAAGEDRRGMPAAVLLPEVKNYPEDKIEIVAPMRLKDALGVKDGDPLTLEFLN